MQESRRKNLLRVLGVDRYQRRSMAQPSPMKRENPVVETPPEAPAKLVSRPAEKSRQKSTKVASKPPQQAAAVSWFWWQFEDLLLIEKARGSSTLEPAFLQLAQNIAAALGRGNGLNGELHWPPGGDFEAISQAEFLRHFLQGRSETRDGDLKLILGCELEGQDNISGDIYRIESLGAMLADPSLKVATWQSLKVLCRT